MIRVEKTERLGDSETVTVIETELDQGVVVAFISALMGLDAEDVQ